MAISFPNESAQYRTARNRLLEQEIALRRTMEALAAARRELPPGGPVDDYVFDGLAADGSVTKIRLSELFEPGWNLFDLTPDGRPDWDEQLAYR